MHALSELAWTCFDWDLSALWCIYGLHMVVSQGDLQARVGDLLMGNLLVHDTTICLLGTVWQRAAPVHRRCCLGDVLHVQISNKRELL